MNKRVCLRGVAVMAVAFLGVPGTQAAGEPAGVSAAPPTQIGSPAYNERLAPDDLRLIVGAQTVFHAAAGRYAAVFSDLTAPAQGFPCLEGSWEGPRRGYLFHLSSPDNGQSGFSVTAEPWKPGVTGKNCFFTNQSGVIRAENGKLPGPGSPTLVEQPANVPAPAPAAPAYQPSGGLGGTLWRWLGYLPPGNLAIGSLRALIGAQVAYNSATGHYAQAIDELLEPASNPPYLVRDDRKYAWPMVGGCRFTLMPVPDPAASFVVVVEPVDRDISGNRWLYTDQSGVIRWSGTPDIGPDSPVL